MSSREPLIIWPPDDIEQTTEGRLGDLLRSAGIEWHRLHDPKWRDKPWHDGIMLDFDEGDVVAFIVAYVIKRADGRASQDPTTPQEEP